MWNEKGKMVDANARLAILRVCLVFFLCFPALCPAVIIDSADGTGNTTPPAGFPYWDAIGTAGGGSCVYIGNGYCLTAYHIKALDWDTGHYSQTVNLGGVNYIIDNTSWNRLKAGSNDADLLQLRLTSIPAVPAVPITSKISSSQAVGIAVWMIGYGFNRAMAKSYWDGSWNLTSPPGVRSGYYWGSGHSMRWGTNQITQNGLLVDDNFGKTQMYKATFDPSMGDNESIVAVGDSGGPVFTFAGNVWRLAGIDLAVDDAYANQPNSTAVYGNASYFADLSAYTITVPGTVVSGTVGLQSFAASFTGQEITIQIRNPGNTASVETQVVALQNSSGSYSFTTSVPAGTYDLAAKGSHWLQQRVPNVHLTNGVNVSFALVNGDCDGDNQVTSADLSIILAAMDSGPGDANWNSQADLDGDGIITSTDMSIVLAVMNLAGDP